MSNQDKLIISRNIKKTIEYADKMIKNYPHEFVLLKNNIMTSFYQLLELSYKASLYKDIRLLTKWYV